MTNEFTEENPYEFGVVVVSSEQRRTYQRNTRSNSERPFQFFATTQENGKRN